MSFLEDGPIRRVMRERRRLLLAKNDNAVDIVRSWRERGYPEPAVKMAMKMADNWLKGVLK